MYQTNRAKRKSNEGFPRFPNLQNLQTLTVAVASSICNVSRFRAWTFSAKEWKGLACIFEFMTSSFSLVVWPSQVPTRIGLTCTRGRKLERLRSSAATLATTPHSGYHYDDTNRRFFEGWYFKVDRLQLLCMPVFTVNACKIKSLA